MDTFPSLDHLGNIYEVLSGKYIESEEIKCEVEKRSLFLLNNGFAKKNIYIAHSSSISFFCDLLAVWKIKSLAICIDSSVGNTDLANMTRIIKPDLFLINKGNTYKHIIDSQFCIDLSRDNINQNKNYCLNYEPFNIDDPVLLLFTSGSTGLPKGVVHTRKSLENKWIVLKKYLNLSEIRETLCPLSTSFGHGLICNSLFPLLNSSNLHILEKRDLEGLLSIPSYIKTKKITFMSSVPSLWNILLNTSKSINANSFQRVHIGSSPLSVRLAKNINNWFGNNPKIFNTYGITETGSWISGGEILKENSEARDGFIGKGWDGDILIVKNYNEKINSNNIIEAKDGEIGEIWIRTNSIMDCYLGEASLTNSVLKNEWFLTGDLAYRNSNNEIFLQGRIKNEINVGGMKVSPEEIDTALEEIEIIKEACTYRVKDALLGEVPHSLISLKKETIKVSHKNIVEKLITKLSNYKIPKKFIVVKEIPKNSRGKVDRINANLLGQGIKEIK